MLAATFVALGCFISATSLLSDEIKPAPAQLEASALEQVFKVDGDLYSGSSPTDDAAFQELAELRIKTIISVDGAKPAVELAHKYGMRYIHLPIGYDGVPAKRAAELVKAALTANGAIYVHCHHGKHRGPAAAAVICRGLKNWSADDAMNWLKQAGTGDEYPGLYRDTREFQKPSVGQIAAIPSALPESAVTAKTVDRMVAIDDYMDRLKASGKAVWTNRTHAHGAIESATLLREEFKELLRLPESKERGKNYVALLAKSEEQIAKLRSILQVEPLNHAAATNALKAVSASCTDCHRKHRN